MKNLGDNNSWNIYFPDIEYSTDNAAMIGVVGYLKYKNSITTDLDSCATARYKI